MDMAARHLNDAHPELVTVVPPLLDELSSFSGRLDRIDEIDHDQHRVFCGRANRMAGHLRAASQLAVAGQPASGLVLCRTALEHHVQDLILHLGQRFVVEVRVGDESWATMLAEFDAQESRWARSLAERPTRSKKGIVTLVYRGMAASNEDPATATYLLHPLYFEMDHYDPTVGRPADQANFDDGLTSVDVRRGLAARNRDTWVNWVSWSAQRRSLELNEIIAGRDLVAIDVHYAFLSGFTHATNAAYEDALGRWDSLRDDGQRELAIELVYLYVAWLGASELDLLTSMEDREPPVRIEGRDELRTLAEKALGAADHLWPPGGQPHEYDRIHAMNQRVFRTMKDDGVRPEPTPIDNEAVRYYSDPLKRLRQMHTSFTELTTRLGYRSPWPSPPGLRW